MKKQIENIKRQAKDEALKSGFVILGAVTGIVGANLIDKMTANEPSLNSVAKYGTPFLLAGGGFILSAATDTGSKAKYFGYGLSVAGFYKGLQLIPFTKDYLQGVLGDTAIPEANQYLTENEDRNKLLKGMGMANVEVNKTNMQEANAYTTRLPELSNNDTNVNDSLILNGLGFSSSITTDADRISGIL